MRRVSAVHGRMTFFSVAYKGSANQRFGKLIRVAPAATTAAIGGSGSFGGFFQGTDSRTVGIDRYGGN